VGVLEMADRDPVVPTAFGHHLSLHVPRIAAVIGHSFAQPDLLAEALTHRSAALSTWAGKRTTSISNERLEFVGDRVLGLLIAEWLAERYPRENEGGLGRRLAYLVSQPVLAEIAERLGLADALSVAPSESKAGVRGLATVLADAMEAVIGALYLDGGIAPARRLVRGAWENAMAAQVDPPKDPKTRLQEWALARGAKLPSYRVVLSEGPSHAPHFVIAVEVGGHEGQGSGSSKRAAEVAAASALLELLAALPAKGHRSRP